MAHRVKEVADLAGVSVRTLHHYDRIGLLKPQFVSPAGYRLYSDGDLEKLQQVLFFKELGLELRDIKRVLESPGYDRRRALENHKEVLVLKKKRIERLIQSVEKTLESITGGLEMVRREMFDAFDMSEIERHQEKFAAEARQMYGHTSAYKESQEKTSGHTRKDWTRISARSNEICNRLAALMYSDPKDPEVQGVIGEWRQLISDSFYSCTPEIFRGLGDLYVADERFTASIDRHQEGLARFMREAMHAYCDNLEK